MLLFLILAGLVSSAAALLILLSAARAAKAGAPLDPTLEVYRRQLTEIDDMAERGLLGDDERRAARAETGRRLLGEAERPGQRGPGLSPLAARRLVTAAAVAAPVAALTAYLLTGSPGLPDMPYKTRLKTWEADAHTDPSRLALPEMAAVLASDAKARPKDPQALYYLGLVERAEGDLAAAIRHLEASADLNPRDPRVWAILGTALVEQGQGQVEAAAADAFRRSLQLDPTGLQPRYFLARADIAAGRTDAGLAAWRELVSGLPATDARRPVLQGEIDQVARTGKLEAAQPAGGQTAEPGQQAAFIQSMVDRLAARLKAQPDDPQGWARLIRAYGVLHQDARRKAAIGQAQQLFRTRPNDLKTALAGDAAPDLPRSPG